MLLYFFFIDRAQIKEGSVDAFIQHITSSEVSQRLSIETVTRLSEKELQTHFK